MFENIKSLQSLNKNLLKPESLPLLASGNPLLDDFLEGGLRWGELSEWGIPWGQGLRDLILPFLRATQQGESPMPWILWIYGQQDVRINPLAWQARGVELTSIRFTSSQQPAQELKPLFLSSFFRMIVIDSVTRLSEEDCAFLSRQARKHRQIILILRSYKLSQDRGNVWAKTRINCWHDVERQRVFAKIIKGRLPRQVSWPDRDAFPSYHDARANLQARIKDVL